MYSSKIKRVFLCMRTHPLAPSLSKRGKPYWSNEAGGEFEEVEKKSPSGSIFPSFGSFLLSPSKIPPYICIINEILV